jgi:hypothetical protein
VGRVGVGAVSIEPGQRRVVRGGPLVRLDRLYGLRKGALAFTLASGIFFLAISGLAQLGAWQSSRQDPVSSSAPLAIATQSADTGLSIIAFSAPDGGLVVYRGDRQIALLGGHGAAVVSAAFIDEDRAILTQDAAGQTRLTRLDGVPGPSAFEIKPALSVLDRELWRPYGAPVARAVQAWGPSAVALPISLTAFLLAFGLFSAPRFGGLARRLRPRPVPPS